MRHRLARRLAVQDLLADGVGQVLDQRAAVRDVENLHAAADRQCRLALRDRGARQRQLQRIAPGVHAI
jgi:hypothetical protein